MCPDHKRTSPNRIAQSQFFKLGQMSRRFAFNPRANKMGRVSCGIAYGLFGLATTSTLAKCGRASSISADPTRIMISPVYSRGPHKK